MSYSYINSDYTFKSLPEIIFSSNFDITHALTFGTAYTTKNLKISTGLNWHSGKPTTNPIVGNEIVNDVINFGATNTEQLKEYLRVDISAIYNFKLSNTTKANLGVSIWNLLDTKNEINNFYRINNDVVKETIQGSLGLTPNIVFRVYF